MKKLLLVSCLLFGWCFHAFPQGKKMVVMGSSSAYGYFPGTSIPRDSAWAFKVSKHYKDLGIIDTLYNIGTPGIDCYITMPTGFTPPPGRYPPDPQFNITKAVSFQPDVIIINLPSNNYTFLSTTEIMSCLQTMKDYANAYNIDVFITTTQPRDDFTQPQDRQKLKEVKEEIMNTFGFYALDFWTAIVSDPLLGINPVYALGDGVHLNPAGHTALKNVVVSKDIFYVPVATVFADFSAMAVANGVSLDWQLLNPQLFPQSMIEHSVEGVQFETIGYAQTNFNGRSSFIHAAPDNGDHFYRILALTENGHREYSSVAHVYYQQRYRTKILVYPNPIHGDEIRLMHPRYDKPVVLQIVNSNGNIVQTLLLEKYTHETRAKLFRCTPGIYFLRNAQHGKYEASFRVL